MRTHDWSVVLVVPRAQQFVALARGFNPHNVNLPGGDRDPEEDATPADTAIRELYEEAGLRTTAEFLSLLDTWKGSRGQPVYGYLVRGFQGRLRAGSEGKPFWTARMNLFSSRQSEFAEHNIRLLKAALDRLLKAG